MPKPPRLAALLLTLAVTAFGLATPALAREEDVRCVQAQLNEAGQDAGAVDGIAGPRTRHALDAFVAAHDLAPGPRLDGRTAINWCRRIGMAVPALRIHWPSRRRDLEFDISDTVDPALARTIRTRAVAARRAVAERLGLPLSATDWVVVGTTRAELRRLIGRHIDYRIRDLDGAIAMHCSDPARLGAFAAPGIMVLCVGPGPQPTSGPAGRELRFVLAHESTHLVQFQVAGSAGGRPRTEDRIELEGPMWMIEGLADLVGYTTMLNVSAEHMRIAALRRYDGEELPDLSTLAARGALDTRRDDVYRAGMIGAALLAEDHGLASLGEMLARMGEGARFDQAFETEFGQTPATFYAGFETRVRPPKGPPPPAPAARTPAAAMPRVPAAAASRFASVTGEPSPDALRCVQAQLIATGYLSGPADGQIGPATRAALGAFTAEAGITGGLPLTPLNAPALCRRNGIAIHALQAFWPSRASAVEVVLAPGVDAGVGILLRLRAEQALRRVVAQTQLPLAATDTLIVGTSRLELRPMLTARLGQAPDGAMARFLNEDCHYATPPRAFLRPGLAVICVSPGLRTSTANFVRTIDQALVDAVSRLALWQVTGVAPEGADAAERIAREGPAWLVAGIQRVSVARASGGYFSPVFHRDLLRRFQGRVLPDLSALDLPGEPGTAEPGDRRDLGALAVAMLIDEHGQGTLGRLVAAIGEGMTFDTAFTQVYGQPPAEFYADFAVRATAELRAP